MDIYYMDTFKHYFESLSEKEIEMGAKLWEDFSVMFFQDPEETNLGDIVEQALNPALEGILGEKMVNYIKAILLDRCIKQISDEVEIEGEEAETSEGKNKPSEEEEEHEGFSAQELLRIFYILTDLISKQKTTIESLEYALRQLNYKEDKDGATN